MVPLVVVKTNLNHVPHSQPVNTVRDTFPMMGFACGEMIQNAQLPKIVPPLLKLSVVWLLLDATIMDQHVHNSHVLLSLFKPNAQRYLQPFIRINCNCANGTQPPVSVPMLRIWNF